MASWLQRLFPIEAKDGNAIRLIVSFLIMRLVISAVFPMAIDETYAIVVSRFPSLSYFDHPPLGFDFARAAAWLAGSEAPLVVRLPHVLSGSLTAWFLYKITEKLFGGKPAFLAVAWYSVAPFFFISSSMFVVPDGPLNFFLALTMWLILPIFTSDTPMTIQRWCALGVAMALALMSKYQAILFGVSILIALLVDARARKSLAAPGPWLALIIAILGLAPMLLWNSNHDWISFKFQSGRAGSDLALYPINFALMQGGQLAYLLPGTWVLALYGIMRGLISPCAQGERTMAIIAILPIAIFDFVALTSQSSLPHWPMSGFLFAFPLIGLATSTFAETWNTYSKRIFHGLCIGLPAFALLIAAQTHTAFLTRYVYQSAPGFDADWQLVSWSALKDEFDKRGIAQNGDAFIVPAIWTEGGRAAYALGRDMPVAVPLTDPRHFQFMGDPRLANRHQGYVVFYAPLGLVNSRAPEIRAAFASRYEATGQMWTITQTRLGFPAFDIGVIPVRNR